MMRRMMWLAGIGAVAVCAGMAFGHFQVLMPEKDYVKGPGQVALEILFTHPMEQGPVMEMGGPVQFGVLLKGKKRDLRQSLVARKVAGKTAYRAAFEVEEPGDHVFYIEPAPYWEAAEGKMIVHYTKVVVNAMSEEDGWASMVGFPVEIEPLVRPYGLWAGNAFRGVVKKWGKPVPFAEIEVEHWNEGGRAAVPNDSFVTQVIKADANGTFTYAMPRAGWWGFAALIEGDEKMANSEGEQVPVELGALMWVRCEAMREK